MEELFDTEMIKEAIGKVFSFFTRNPNNRLEKLEELRDQAQYIRDKTGRSPVSWYEYKRLTPEKPANLMRSIMIGATIGLVGAALMIGVLAMFSLQPSFPLILGLNTLIAGGSAAYNDYKNQPASHLLKEYAEYLDDFEEAAGVMRACAIDKMPPLCEGEYVARLRQESPASLLRLIK